MLISFIIWLAVTAGLVLLTVNAIPPFQSLTTSDLYLLIEEMKLAFVLLILPLVAPQAVIQTNEGKDNADEQRDCLPVNNGRQRPVPLRQPASPVGGVADEATSRSLIFIYYLIFSLLFIPLSMLGVTMSGKGINGLLTVHLFLLILWFIATGIGKAYTRWYYLVVFLLSAVVPLLYYLVLEIAGQNWVNILYLNPFWLIYKI